MSSPVAVDHKLRFSLVEDHEYKALVPIAKEAFGMLHPENTISSSPYRRALARLVNHWTPKEMADYCYRRSRKRLCLPHVLRDEKRVVGYALHKEDVPVFWSAQVSCKLSRAFIANMTHINDFSNIFVFDVSCVILQIEI